MSRWQESLDTATDRIEAPSYAGAVLAEARRRRARRQGAMAAVAASIVVAATVGGAALVRPADVPAPSVPPAATSPSVFDLRGPDRDHGGPTPSQRPAPDPDAWDPRTVDDLPLAPRGPVALPAVITPPDDAPALADAPVDAVKVAVAEDGEDTLVFSTSGEWRSVPTPGESPRVEVSPEGTRLLIWYYDAPTEVTVVDVTSGATSQVEVDDDTVSAESDQWQWLDERTLQVTGGWRVDALTGSTARTDYPRHPLWTVDPDGEVVEVESTYVSEYDDWAPGGLRGVQAPYDRLYQVAAGDDEVAGLAGDPAFASVSFVLFDRATLEERARLPIRDPDAVYSNWGGGALAVAPGGDVLLRVANPGRGTGDRVVRWDPGTDELDLVTTVDLGPMPRQGPAPLESWAAGLLRQSVP